MKLKQYLLLMALLSGLIGCSTTQPTVSFGIYRNGSTGNFIAISTDKMRIHIEDVDNRDMDGNGLSFDYGFTDDGHLYPIVQRSVEILYGYPSLDYQLGGEKIIATDFRHGKKWVFVKSER